MKVHPQPKKPSNVFEIVLQDSDYLGYLSTIMDLSLHPMNFSDLCIKMELGTKLVHLSRPSSNGQAERYVATLKQSLRAMHKYEGTIQQKLSTFLMQYRKAPNVTTST
ncbi:hypothetical protein TNCV_484691 [Trichonephila clavipes]|nr:hypothetical protein TNCV_484691 [Trichonephila clavipes]